MEHQVRVASTGEIAVAKGTGWNFSKSLDDAWLLPEK
jgi:hypothetical protein